MSVWSWKKSGWLNLAFCSAFISALILSLISIGLRSSFLSFPEEIRIFITYFCMSSLGGGYYPEVGFYNLLLFVSSVLGMACVILRYVYVTDKNIMLSSVTLILNKLSILPGLSSFAGLILVASFPLNCKQKGGHMHTSGSYMFFCTSLLYSILQTIITYLYGKCTKAFVSRLVLLFILAGAFISCVALIEVNKSENGKLKIDEFNSTENETTGEQQAVDLRLLAFGMERGFVFVYICFFLTFFMEFQTISTYMILRPVILSSPSDYSSSWTVNERV